MSETEDTHARARRRHRLRVVLIVLICVLAALLLSVDSVYALLQGMLHAAEPLIAAHPWLGALVFVLLAAVSALLAFFSSAVLVPAAVFTWGRLLTIALLWIGWLLGGLFAFWLGRGLRTPPGQPSRLPPRIAAHLPKLSEHVRFPLVLLWQLALPSEVPGYLCGYLGVPLRTYLAALALGELPFALGAVLLGESVVKRELGWLIALGVLAASAFYLLARLLHRRGNDA